MKYENIRTGAIIDVSTELHGDNWRACPAEPPVAPVQRKKRVKKEDIDE